LVPVNCKCSRTTQSKGVFGYASTLAALPLIVNAVAAMRFLSLESHLVVVGRRLIRAFSGHRPDSCGDGNSGSA
jgi:hypothetical protein